MKTRPHILSNFFLRIIPALFIIGNCAIHASAGTQDGLQTLDINGATLVRLGEGFNLLDGNFTTGNVLDDRLQGTNLYKTVNVNETKFLVGVFDTIQSLSSEMTAGGDASYGGFGGADVSVIKNSSFNAFSSYGVLRLRYTARIEELNDSAKLLSRQSLKRLTSTKSPEGFTKAYGDECVIQRYRGGILTLWFRTQASSVEGASTNSAHLHVGIGAFGGKGEYEKGIQELTKCSKLEIQGYRFGGANDGHFIVTNLEDMPSILEGFQKSVDTAMAADKAWDNTIRVGLGSYIAFKNFPDEKQTVLRDVDRARLILKGIIEKRSACEIALSDFRFADLNSSYYSNYSNQTSKSNQISLQERVRWLNDAELTARENGKVDVGAHELIDPIDSSVDVFGGYQIIPVQLEISSGQVNFLRLKSGGDRDVHTKSGRETVVRLNTRCGEEDNQKPYVEFEMSVQEKEGNHTFFKGTTKLYPKVPPQYSEYKVVGPGSNVECHYNDVYRTQRNGFFDATGYLKALKSGGFVDKLRLCIDTSDSNDEPYLGFEAQGWVTFLMVHR